ncbi:MAG: hypothetical protein JWR19_2125 [Pedosphaera sp.]|nr:hypothetical protein [Pedosphaera sp.]
MTNGESHPPELSTLIRKFALTGLSALQNRGELIQVELQEEKNRIIEMIIWGATVCFLALMFLVVFTATLILLFPEHLRVYAAGGFSLLYLVGAVLALLNLKALVKSASLPFADTVAEVKKDREWLESLK